MMQTNSSNIQIDTANIFQIFNLPAKGTPSYLFSDIIKIVTAENENAPAGAFAITTTNGLTIESQPEQTDFAGLINLLGSASSVEDGELVINKSELNKFISFLKDNDAAVVTETGDEITVEVNQAVLNLFAQKNITDPSITANKLKQVLTADQTGNEEKVKITFNKIKTTEETTAGFIPSFNFNQPVVVANKDAEKPEYMSPEVNALRKNIKIFNGDSEITEEEYKLIIAAGFDDPDDLIETVEQMFAEEINNSGEIKIKYSVNDFEKELLIGKDAQVKIDSSNFAGDTNSSQMATSQKFEQPLAVDKMDENILTEKKILNGKTVNSEYNTAGKNTAKDNLTEEMPLTEQEIDNEIILNAGKKVSSSKLDFNLKDVPSKTGTEADNSFEKVSSDSQNTVPQSAVKENQAKEIPVTQKIKLQKDAPVIQFQSEQPDKTTADKEPEKIINLLKKNNDAFASLIEKLSNGKGQAAFKINMQQASTEKAKGNLLTEVKAEGNSEQAKSLNNEMKFSEEKPFVVKQDSSLEKNIYKINIEKNVPVNNPAKVKILPQDFNTLDYEAFENEEMTLKSGSLKEFGIKTAFPEAKVTSPEVKASVVENNISESRSEQINNPEKVLDEKSSGYNQDNSKHTKDDHQKPGSDLTEQIEPAVKAPEVAKGSELQNIHNAKTEKFAEVLESSRPAASEFSDTHTRSMKASELVDEVEKLILKRENTNIEIKLNPQNLGKVKLTIDVTKSLVNTNIEVENESVKQFVQNNIEQLKQSLNNNGLQLNTFTVSLSTQEQKPQARFEQKKKLNLNKSELKADNPVKAVHVRRMGYNTYEYLA